MVIYWSLCITQVSASDQIMPQTTDQLTTLRKKDTEHKQSQNKKQVGMTMKCHNHTHQANPQRREKEACRDNSNMTPSIEQTRKVRKLLPLSLPARLFQNYKDTAYCITKQGLNIKPHKQWEQQLASNE